MQYHIIMSIVWLVYSLVVSVIDIRSGRKVGEWSILGIIVSNLWLATI